MTAKEYLQQARHLDECINSKIEMIDSLNGLATKATATLTGMPHNPNKGVSSMADIVAKLVDLQTEINTDIDKYVDLKADIIRTIKKTSKPEYQTILEKRYLDLMSWDDIAEDMRLDRRWVFRLHGKALEEIEHIRNSSMKQEEQKYAD